MLRSLLGGAISHVQRSAIFLQNLGLLVAQFEYTCSNTSPVPLRLPSPLDFITDQFPLRRLE